jgi:hypothetical protein
MLLLCPWLVLALPGLIPFILGSTAMLLTARGPVRFGAVSLDLHTSVVGAMLMIMGSQTLLIAFAARTYALSEEIGPLPRGVRLLRNVLSFERTVLVGVIIFLAGMASIGAVAWRWIAAGFTQLPLTHTMRPVIIGATLAVIGAQIALSAFFHAMLESRNEPQATCDQ